MEDFNYYYNALTKRLDKLESVVISLQKSPPESINKIIQECDAESRRIEQELEGCETAIQTLEKGPEKLASERSYNLCRERFNKCKTEIEFKRSKGQSHALFGNHFQDEEQKDEKPKRLGDMSAQQVIERGDMAYGEAESRLMNALGITEQSKQVVGGIEVELKEQEDQIDRIHDKTEDIRSNLKRANKVMDLIYRRYLTDKCIAVLIIMIIIILIIIIAFGIVKSGNVSFATDSIN